MSTGEPTIRLEHFEGPLDLLLHLIRRAEVEITRIPIASIADQYLEHLRGIERIDIDLAGDFLVMAATLMEIKSRMLSPTPGGSGGDMGEGEGSEDGEDPRSELIQQLLEYKRTRDAADALESLRARWMRQYPLGRAGVDRDALDEAGGRAAELEIEDLELYDLVEAFAKILQQVDFEKLGDHTVTAEEDVPLELHEEDILERLRAAPETPDGSKRIAFREIFRARTRLEIIGLFLATLELVKSGQVGVEHKEDATDGIFLTLRESATDAPEAPAEMVVRDRTRTDSSTV